MHASWKHGLSATPRRGNQSPEQRKPAGLQPPDGLSRSEITMCIDHRPYDESTRTTEQTRNHVPWPPRLRSAHDRAWYLLAHIAATEVHLEAIGHPAEASAMHTAACLTESLLEQFGAFELAPRFR